MRLPEFWMRKAIDLAQMAERNGDRPFGCVVVQEDRLVIGHGIGTGNDEDPTRHSEIMAIQMASAAAGRPLDDCTIYSTHEPCLMCTGAIFHAHIPVVVFGSSRSDLPELFRDYTWGVTRWLDSGHPPVVSRVLKDECIHLFDAEIAALVVD